jgi:hypothetical protein
MAKARARRSRASSRTTRKRPSGPKAPVLPGPAKLRAIYSELRSLPNIQGCFIGWKRRKGRTTRRLAIVCCVQEKIADRKLEPGNRVPSTIDWQVTTKRRRSLPTDVQTAGSHGLQSGAEIIGPGDLVSGIGGASNLERGTIGVIMSHPTFGRTLTTAAHVLDASTPGTVTFPRGSEPVIDIGPNGRLDGTRVPGIVHCLVITETADYAVISAVSDTELDNLYLDRQQLGPPHIPTATIIGSSAFALTSRGRRHTIVRGIQGALQIGPLSLRDLILVDQCTRAGDSGCCLIDHDSRILGLLEGVTEFDGQSYSVFSSAIWPFILEHAEFV